MFRLLALASALTLLAGSVGADDKKDKSETTTWERESNGLDLKIDIGKDTMKITVFMGDNGVIATCKASVDKDGLVKAKVTAVEEKGNFPAKPKVGLELSFKWKVDGNTATLSELKGEGLEEAKAIAEGDYKKKK